MSPNLLLAKPSAGRLGNPRVLCAVTLSLVFLCGAVAGALAMNMGIHRGLHNPPFWTDAGKAAYLERLRKDLDLSPGQVEQISTVLDDFNHYYVTVLTDGKSRILHILSDDQRHKFEHILQERKGH